MARHSTYIPENDWKGSSEGTSVRWRGGGKSAFAQFYGDFTALTERDAGPTGKGELNLTTESTKDGTFEIIRKGELELSSLVEGNHLSTYRDLLVSETDAPMSVGFWQPQGVGELLFDFPYSEAMLVMEGEIVFEVPSGDIHTARVGDLLIFYAPIKVTFLAQSAGLVFTAMQGTPY